MTTTDIIVVDSQSSPLLALPPSFRALFDTSMLTDAELIDRQILETDYTGGETVNAKQFYSRTIALDGEKRDRIIWLWGFMAYPKQRTDEITGEVQQKVGIVFRLGDANEPGEQFLSFESTAANTFVQRSLFPLIQRGIIGIGDWQIGLPIQVWEVPAKVGHTFRFKLRKPSEV